jgi:hypothetical protein
MQDIKYFHEMSYQKPKKDIQDHFMVKHTSISAVKRRQAVKGTYSEKEATVNYFVRDRAHNLVRVRRGAFLTIIGISARRVNTVLKKYNNTGNVDEKRGGFCMKVEFQTNKECVIQFIISLKCVESHYCRERVTGNNYLHS